ncbi:S8 family peptidase [Blautia liquoris]|uniref:S8 family peptidase n=1 Tax=Blautia liquoris TaxID=2779518 RepID=A0A7M2RJK1_9FIRM|nr:S8 family peptidase [Blautia liquoris]QOV19510.1 S8 family peptidase [Blautia liquoris]
MEKILDEQYYDLVVNNSSLTPDLSANITPINERESILHVYRGNTTDMCTVGKYLYHNFPTFLTLTSLISLNRSGVQSIQSNPYLALFGQGVLVGFIDTGITYQHPAFLHSDGSTRIARIWDQTIQDGPPPLNYTYGTEYTAENINLALESDSPLSVVPSTDTNGHGTAVASVAAGSIDEENSFSGVVPESDLLVVKLKEAKQNLRELFLVPSEAVCYQDSDVMLAIRYLVSTASLLNRPLVICIALGSSQNGHDGEGSTNTYLDYLTQSPQIGVSCAAGNEGSNRRHYYGSVTAPPYQDEIELQISARDTMFSMEIWSNSPAVLTVEIISPLGESTQIIYPRINNCSVYTFTRSQAVVWVNNYLLEQESGSQFILIRLRNPNEGVWSFRVQNINNENYTFHSWLPSGDLISNDTYFVQSSPSTTITSPGNAEHVMTITAYNQNNDTILLNSSRGYTRTGIVKPNLAAPGFELTCAVNSGGYGSYTGTGAAAAHAAGIMAMLFEWGIVRGNYTQVTGNDISNLLMWGAQCTISSIYPNNIWGYGTIDLQNLFDKLSF